MADGASSLILNYIRRFECTPADLCAELLDIRKTIPEVGRRIEKRLDLVKS